MCVQNVCFRESARQTRDTGLLQVKLISSETRICMGTRMQEVCDRMKGQGGVLTGPYEHAFFLINIQPLESGN